jgi:DNA-3-methyladenine glycosylase
MYGPPGRSYVYLIYGYHFCFNAVCRPKGTGEAVLVRAIEVEFGEEFMRTRRPGHQLVALTNGPAKLCVALDIDRGLDGSDLCDVESPLIIAANPAVKEFRLERGPIVTTPRIGITRAADLALRFCLATSPFLSRKVSKKILAPRVVSARNPCRS